MPKGVWSTATADTAGRITFAANHGNPVLHTLTTRIKADRFAKGKLLLSSTSRATVKVDDQTLISKGDFRLSAYRCGGSPFAQPRNRLRHHGRPPLHAR